MGLDMYLEAEALIFDSRGGDEEATLRAVAKYIGLKPTDFAHGTVALNVAYWRKANAIHAWFVDNVQGGKDECERTEVSQERLRELFHLCSLIRGGILVKDLHEEDGLFGTYEWGDTIDISEGAMELIKNKLAPRSGFFFGGTEIDYDYVRDLDLTIEQLRPLVEYEPGDGKPYLSFFYQSSW